MFTANEPYIIKNPLLKKKQGNIEKKEPRHLSQQRRHDIIIKLNSEENPSGGIPKRKGITRESGKEPCGLI